MSRVKKTNCIIEFKCTQKLKGKITCKDFEIETIQGDGNEELTAVDNRCYLNDGEGNCQNGILRFNAAIEYLKNEHESTLDFCSNAIAAASKANREKKQAKKPAVKKQKGGK